MRKARNYFLRVRDLRYAGSADHRYRLSAGKLPIVTSVFPLGGATGASASLSLFGINLSGVSTNVNVRLPAEPGIWEAPILVQSVPLDVSTTPSTT